MDEVTEVRGGKVVDGFVGEKSYFEVNPVFDGEALEDMGDVVGASGGGEHMGSGVLDIL